MSTGSAGIGSVSVENPHNEAFGQPDYVDLLTVSQVWSSGETGVKLSGGDIDGDYYLTDEAALELAALLFMATQPANIPNNGYEAWVQAVSSTAADVIEASRDSAE